MVAMPQAVNGDPAPVSGVETDMQQGQDWVGATVKETCGRQIHGAANQRRMSVYEHSLMGEYAGMPAPLSRAHVCLYLIPAHSTQPTLGVARQALQAALG